ncbi:hypothetical protein E2C01_053283 [Portunus trituberculatus]|uniref:Uncharacterized protein n=1 Tax=Portunus trituberculatus TaxID=210409 RepID=A0A5B7GPX3_PORTR|nr:hypothetical protein [Portunus trituberculatus]
MHIDGSVSLLAAYKRTRDKSCVEPPCGSRSTLKAAWKCALSWLRSQSACRGVTRYNVLTGIHHTLLQISI